MFEFHQLASFSSINTKIEKNWWKLCSRNPYIHNFVPCTIRGLPSSIRFKFYFSAKIAALEAQLALLRSKKKKKKSKSEDKPTKSAKNPVESEKKPFLSSLKNGNADLCKHSIFFYFYWASFSCLCCYA